MNVPQTVISSKVRGIYLQLLSEILVHTLIRCLYFRVPSTDFSRKKNIPFQVQTVFFVVNDENDTYSNGQYVPLTHSIRIFCFLFVTSMPLLFIQHIQYPTFE